MLNDLRIKYGVSLRGIQPEILVGMLITWAVFIQEDADLVLTSVLDGIHSKNSLHYGGFAFDARTRHITKDRAQRITARLKENLGAEFDVVLEDDHLHVEYDPK